MIQILRRILHHPTLYSETNEEYDVIDQLCSLGMIYYVNTEQQQGWHITAKGIAFYRESTES